MLSGIDLLHVPYKGVQPALLDVSNGQISMTFASIMSAMPQIKNNRLRPLAITSSHRSPAAKELPTMIEAGVKDYDAVTWYGLLAPAGTPTDITGKLNTEVVAIMKNPEMNERLSREGADPIGSSPAEFSKHIQAEIDKWRKVIKAAGIQPN